MKQILIIIIVAFSFAGCKKDNLQTYTLSGYLYDKCNGVPLKNEKLVAWQFHPSKEQIRGTATTDSTGFFTLDYNTIDNVVEIRFANTTYAVLRYRDSIDLVRNLENLKVYEQNTTNIIVKLNVINPGTVNDSLVINDFRTGNNLTVRGPFTNGTLYTASNYSLLVPNYINYKTIGYSINNATAIYKQFEAKPCIDAIVTIDVNL